SATSALAVILTGISLRLLVKEPQPTGLRIETTLYALGALATGVVSLFLTSATLRAAVGHLIIAPSIPAAPTSLLGPPSLTGALAAIFISPSALLLQARPRWAVVLAATLSTITFLFCIFVVTVCLYGGSRSFTAGHLMHMTLPDSVAFAALSAAILLARPEAGLPALLASAH